MKTIIENYINELTLKYEITKESLFGMNRHRKGRDHRARTELVSFLKLNRLSAKEIANYLKIKLPSVYIMLRQSEDIKQTKINTVEEVKQPIETEKKLSDYSNDKLIDALLEEKKSLESKLNSIAFLIKLYMEKGMKF